MNLSKKQTFFIVFVLLLLIGSFFEKPSNILLFIQVVILSVLYWGVFEFIRYMIKEVKRKDK